MMDGRLAALGYEFEPSKYSPGLGFSRLRMLISGRPTQRFFAAKALHVPTFDGRFFHPTQLTRHELKPEETFQVCLGPLSLESFGGERMRAFSFGGLLRATVHGDDLLCELTSTAPIFELKDSGELSGNIIVEELTDLLAELEVTLAHHEDELYSRLAKFEPYQLFLACLVSLQKRADAVPVNLRRDQYHQAVSALHRAAHIVKETDGWDGKSPSLEDLLSSGAPER